MNSPILHRTTIQRRRGGRPWRWLKGGMLGLLAIVVFLLLAGVTYQAVGAATDARRYPPPGQLLDVGGYHLHLHCLGQGSPTVILDAASIDTVSGWAWVQPEVARATRVCAYDRAGQGWSDLSPAPPDAAQNTPALHTLLQQVGIEMPYVLVGHSFGGLYARAFAHQYPDEVAGLVLIEAFHPDNRARLGQPETMPNAPDVGQIAAGQFLARFGFFRLVSSGADNLLDAEFTYNVEEWRPEVDYSVSGNRGQLTVSQPEGTIEGIPDDSLRNEWQLRLNSAIPMSLNANLGVGQSRLDLSGLTLTGLTIRTGVGETTIDLTGDWQQSFDVNIEGGVGEITLELGD